MPQRLEHPINFQILEKGDPGYDKGYRVRIVLVDGDVFYFGPRNKQRAHNRAIQFCQRESLQPISDEEMATIRNGTLGK